MGICTKLSEIDFQICDDFAHPSCDALHEMPATLRKTCATNLHNTHPSRPPPPPVLETSDNISTLASPVENPLEITRMGSEIFEVI